MRERKEIAEIFHATFSTGEGKEVLKYLQSYCFKDQEVFNADNSKITDYNLGRLSVIRQIEKLVKEGEKDE